MDHGITTDYMEHNKEIKSMNHRGMNHGEDTMSGMSMFFHGGHSETFLFEFWKISSFDGLMGSVIGIIIMAALYEGLKYYREYIFMRTCNGPNCRGMPQGNMIADDNQIVQLKMLSWMHTFQTSLHIVQVMLSYLLMLIFMTYNIWLCFAVVFGTAIGFFLFGWKKSVVVDITEHCH